MPQGCGPVLLDLAKLNSGSKARQDSNPEEKEALKEFQEDSRFRRQLALFPEEMLWHANDHSLPALSDSE